MNRLDMRIAASFTAVIVGSMAPVTMAVAQLIDMGPAPLLGAFDQPFVRFEMAGNSTSFGPSSSANLFLLDTGASSILAVGGAAADLRRSSGDFRQGDFLEQGIGGFTLYDVSAPYTANVWGSRPPTLEAGDADQDLAFGQLDIVQVLQADKYLTGRAADWGEGDWADAVGGYPGAPTQGDGRFDQQDIIAALQHGLYNKGPYAVEADGVGGVSRNDIRILSNPAQSFGDGVGFEGIVGMPAMTGRFTTLDMTLGGGTLGGPDFDLFDLDQLIDSLLEGGVSSGIGVSFTHTLPPSNGHRYGVSARALHFDPDQPLPVPTVAPLPIVTASHHLGDKSVSGDNYIIDTGAQLSFMSLDKARALGLDPADPFTTLPIAGVGGIRDVPVFLVERLSLMTQEGVELVWRDVQVIGLDLDPTIDGVIGSDLLTAGMIETNLESFDLDDLFTIGEGPIEQVHFDFRTLDRATKDGTGTMYFDLNPDFDVVRDDLADIGSGIDEDLLDDLGLLDQFSDLFGGVAIAGGRGLAESIARYTSGRFAALALDGRQNDAQTSLVYDANTGEVSVDAPAGLQLTSINIDSAAGIFTGTSAESLGGSFDNDTDNNIFKATFGSSFGSLSFGTIAQAGLAENFLLNDLSVVGSLAGGGGLGDVDLIYVPVPEPSTLAMLSLALLAGAAYGVHAFSFSRRMAARQTASLQ